MLAFGTMTSFAFELAQALRHLSIQLFGLRAVWYYHIVFLHNSKIECDSLKRSVYTISISQKFIL